MGASHSSAPLPVKKEMVIKTEQPPPPKITSKNADFSDLDEFLPKHILNFPITRETLPEYDAREIGEYRVSHKSLAVKNGPLFDGTTISSLLNEKLYHWAYALLESENELKNEKIEKSENSEKIDEANFKKTGLNLTPSHPVPSLEELDEDIVVWWENDGDFDQNSEESESETETAPTATKWKSLSHNGVYFPPPPPPLPRGVDLLFRGQKYPINNKTQEMAMAYAKLIGTEHVKSPIFRANFFADFMKFSEEFGEKFPKNSKFEDFDFRQIAAYLETTKAKNLSKEEKEQRKEEAMKIKQKFGFCKIDENLIELGNFRVEPAGIFMGRGEHPLRGKYKKALTPSSISLNLSPNSPIPSIPSHFKNETWGAIVHNPEAQWIAMWKDPIQNGTKYVTFSSNNHFKGKSDFNKFTRARKLSGCIDEVRMNYFKIIDEAFSVRQIDTVAVQSAIVTHIIDVTAIRPGGDKDPTSKAFTVGAQSLMKDNVVFLSATSTGFFNRPTQSVHLNFKGKDSVVYNNIVHLDSKAVKIMQKLHEKALYPPKDPVELKQAFNSCKIFDKLNCKILNEFMKGLTDKVKVTPKVFRTYNASVLFDHLIRNIDSSETLTNKVKFYSKANVEVARKCNHQKAITQSTNKANLKKYAKVIQLTVELTIAQLEALYWMKISFDRMLGKCSLDNQDMKKIDVKQIREILESYEEASTPVIEDETAVKKPKQSKLEIGRNIQPKLKNAAKKYATVLKKLKKAWELFAASQEIKNLAAETSKINYLDPRITVAYCKRAGVPLTRFYNKNLIMRFPWALEASQDFVFDLKEE